MHDAEARGFCPRHLQAADGDVGAALDMLPQHHLLNNGTRKWGMFSWHWFFMAQPNPTPEYMISADPEFFKATSTGAETTGLVNVWTYDLNGGPVVDGQPLDFEQQSQPWQPCARSNLTPPDSIGVTVRYTYRARTPLGFLVPYFNQITIVERSVMAENVSR